MTAGEDGDDSGDSADTWDVSLDDLEAGTDPEPLAPGTPSAENVAFLLLGVLLTLAVIYRIVAIVGTTIG